MRKRWVVIHRDEMGKETGRHEFRFKQSAKAFIYQVLAQDDYGSHDLVPIEKS